MSNRRESLTVKIQGRDFSFKCPVESSDDLKRAAAQLDDILDNLRGESRLGTLEQAAILAGINLIDQINRSAHQLNASRDTAKDSVQEASRESELASASALVEAEAQAKLKQEVNNLKKRQGEVLSQLDSVNQCLDAALDLVNSLDTIEID